MPRLPDFFGLDLGNHSIKVVQVKWKGNTPEITNYAKVETPYGLIGSENVDHQKMLAAKINEVVKEAKISTRKAVVALPEAPIFTSFEEFPKLPEDELREAVHWAAKKLVPLPQDEVEQDFIVVGEKNKDDKIVYEVLIVAAPKTLVNRYLRILDFAQLEPLALETESIALTRAISLGNKIDHSIALDFGANSTDLAVIKDNHLVFSQSIGIGSDALTKAIASDFGFELKQAEEYKIAYGIKPDELEGKIAESLAPVMDSISAEIIRTIEYFKSNSDIGAPNSLLLLGDGSLLPGLVEYMAKKIGVEVALGDPALHLDVSKKITNEVKKKASALAVSIGLALKVN